MNVLCIACVEMAHLGGTAFVRDRNDPQAPFPDDNIGIIFHHLDAPHDAG